MSSQALARRLHVSGPIAVVVAGLLIGNHGRSFAMSDRTRENLDKFWELIDEMLNAVLFVLIGLEVILASPSTPIPSTPLLAFRSRWQIPRGTVRLLTWGGLRGGISIALALSLPHGPHRDAILAITYGVVVSSILVQGLTIKVLARRLAAPDDGKTASTEAPAA